MAEETVVATNRQAHRDYDIIDTYEAGLVLVGSEVKSLRESKVQLSEAFGRIDRRGEAWLLSLHISPYSHQGSAAMGHKVDRSRKLLLNRHEIERIQVRTDQDRLAIVPLRLYFKGGRAKVEIGIGRGKDQRDKRQDIAKRDAEREARRELSRRNRG